MSLSDGDYMKKLFKILLVIIISVVAISTIVFIFKALFNLKKLVITDFDINAIVQNNGNMKVDLINEYKFNGKYNGVYIKIPKKSDSNTSTYNSINDSSLPDELYNSSGIKDFKVYLQEDGQYVEFSKVNYATNGDKYVYTQEEHDDYTLYKIYEPSQNESKTFKMSYTLIDTAVKHLDCSEVYWNFIGGEYDCDIEKLDINLRFESPTNVYNTFIHGKQGGKLKTNGNNINVQYSNIYPKQYVGLRTLFASNNLKNVTKYSNQYALPIVSEQEKVLQDRTDKRILFNNIMIGGILALVMYYIFLLVKYEYDKLFIVYNDKEYELLSKYNPMILACIAQNREMNPRDIMAVLLDLVNKKVVKMQVINNIDKKNYILTKTDNNIEIDDIEKSVLELFFDTKDEIDLDLRIKELTRPGDYVQNISRDSIKHIDELVITKLNDIGANTVKVGKPLLVFNNILFIITCIIIVISTIFNISLETTGLSQNGSDSFFNLLQFFTYIMLSAIGLLPIALAIIYLLLHMLIDVKNYIGRLAFKFSGKKLIKEVISFTLISSVIFTILFLTVRNEHIIIDTALFMIALLIIMTDNLMSKHDIKIYKTFLSLKMIQDKLENGSLLNEKKIDDVILWEKYLTFAIALGITDVSKYAKGLEIQDNLDGFISHFNSFTDEYYDIDNFDRDTKINNMLHSFENRLSSYSGSYSGSIGSGSSFGGGGFSGGGGRGSGGGGF